MEYSIIILLEMYAKSVGERTFEIGQHLGTL